jgi:hypothetical protein
MRENISLCEDSLACPASKKNTETRVSKEQWWSVTERGKQKYLEKNLPQCHFALSTVCNNNYNGKHDNK